MMDALVRGTRKYGGKMALSTPVEQVVMEDGRAVGMRLKNGRTIRARRAVVSNASVWDTVERLLPPEVMEVGGVHVHIHVGVQYTLSNPLG